MAVTGYEITSLLVQIVVMLAIEPVPFTAAGAREGVPLGVSVARALRFIPKSVHQAEVLLHYYRAARIPYLAHPLI